MKRNVRRARIRGILGLGALIALLLVYVIGPRFVEPARVRSAAAATQAEKQQLDLRITTLNSRSADMDAARAEMAFYNGRLPATSATLELEESVNAAADRVGLGRSRVTLVRPDAPTPVLVNPIDAAKAAENKATATPTPSTSATPSPSPSASPDPAKTDLWEMPVTVEFSANNYGIIVKFVNAMYSMTRLMVVDHVTVTPAGGGYSVQVVGRAFILKAGATGEKEQAGK